MPSNTKRNQLFTNGDSYKVAIIPVFELPLIVVFRLVVAWVEYLADLTNRNCMRANNDNDDDYVDERTTVPVATAATSATAATRSKYYHVWQIEFNFMLK